MQCSQAMAVVESSARLHVGELRERTTGLSLLFCCAAAEAKIGRWRRQLASFMVPTDPNWPTDSGAYTRMRVGVLLGLPAPAIQAANDCVKASCFVVVYDAMSRRLSANRRHSVQPRACVCVCVCRHRLSMPSPVKRQFMAKILSVASPVWRERSATNDEWRFRVYGML